jgi:hypothetical protein
MGIWLAFAPLHDHDVFTIARLASHFFFFTILIFTCLEFFGSTVCWSG